MPRYLVTSALPYANGPIHFGHVIGAYLPADVYVRYRRMLGDEVLFVCGTDEHGVAITINAEAQGVGYREFVDRWYREIGDTLRAFGIEFDIFSGTNRCPHHERISQQFFSNLDRNGYLLQKVEKQWYCETNKMFLADRYLEGTCPFCGAENARGDECKVCGQWIDALQLKNPRCKLCGNPPVVRETKHWYLDLPKIHADGLGTWFDGEDPSREHVEWKPNVRAFVGNMLADLHPRPITRDLRWGVPLPKDVGDTDGKVLYVWFDAPIGYCSITQEHLENAARAKGAKAPADAWLSWWTADDVRLLHFIGKDNIGFHTIVFPAMLFGQKGSLGKRAVLPWAVPANEFYNLQGRKFSTSDGWTIDPNDFLKRFPNVDALRFTLLATSPQTADSEFSYEAYQRLNNELADAIGNLLSRSAKLALQNGIAEVAPPKGARPPLATEATNLAGAWRDALEAFDLRRACECVMQVAAAANLYFDQRAPWKQVSSDPAAARETLFWSSWCLDLLSVLLEPLTPRSARAIRKSLGLAERRSGTFDAAAIPTNVTYRLSEPPILFQKYDDKSIAAEVAALRAKFQPKPTAMSTPPLPNDTPAPPSPPKAAAAPAAPADPNAAKATITYDDFTKLELRAGTILSAERVAKADKLLLLQVDIGREKRQVVAGIAAKYTPEELVNRRVVVVCNLAPKTLRGVESHGMVLAGDDGRGPVLVTPLAELQNGATVK